MQIIAGIYSFQASVPVPSFQVLDVNADHCWDLFVPGIGSGAIVPGGGCECRSLLGSIRSRRWVPVPSFQALDMNAGNGRNLLQALGCFCCFSNYLVTKKHIKFIKYYISE